MLWRKQAENDVMSWNKWKPITELREVRDDYSGRSYTYQYAKKHKNLKNWYCECCRGETAYTIGIREQLKIRKNP